MDKQDGRDEELTLSESAERLGANQELRIRVTTQAP